MAKVSMNEIGWQEGQDADFADLHDAIKAGKTGPVCRAADSSDESVEDEEDPGENARPGDRFLWAAQYNKLELVDKLVREAETASGGGILCRSRRKLINFKDDDGYTALHRAAYSNHPDMVIKLLKLGADLHARTSEDQWVPLHSACRWNSAPCVEILLAWGADVNALTQGNQTPLHLAAFCGNSRDTLQLLIMHPDIKSLSFNCQQDTAKDIALRNGNCVDLFDLLEPQFRTY